MAAMPTSKRLDSPLHESFQTLSSCVSSRDLDEAYSPPLKNQEIRLLEIRMVESPHQQKRKMTYAFRRVLLDTNTLPPYTAISYRWDECGQTRPIRLASGGALSIGQTLCDLFNSLTEKKSCLNLWVDAICMRQDDVEEKAAQVLLMGSVYSRASQVLVWLGNSTQTSERAFRYMRSKAKLAEGESIEEKDELKCLEDVFMLLSLSWFRRVWVIQEVTLNDNVTVRCGGDEVAFDVFQHCVNQIWTFLDFEDGQDAAFGLWCVTRLFSIRDKFQKHNKLSYEDLLEAAFHYDASDVRDLVYAFRGIADNSRPVPEPDYAKSADTLFVETAKALLCHGRCLDLLVLCGFKDIEDRSLHIPTWAPNLNIPSWDEPLVVANKAGWHAGGSFAVSPLVDDRQPGLLHIRARPIATIEQVLPPFDCDTLIGQQAAVNAILEMRPAHISYQDWLNSVFSTLIFGLNIDDEPDLEGYYESFLEWLTSFQSDSEQPDPRSIAQNKYHLTMKNRVNDWRALMTGDKMLGVSSPSVAEGDFVFVVPGCRLPLILRADKSSIDGTDNELLSKRTWELVSWAFVGGLMFGGEDEMQPRLIDITLR